MHCSRRGFFDAVGRSVATNLTDAIAFMRQAARPEAPTGARRGDHRGESAAGWTRPPGALPERDFLQACTRCADCVSVCPHSAIRRLGETFGEACGTPAVVATEGPCYLCAGLPCAAACPTGALEPGQFAEVRMGLAVIDFDSCYLAQKQPCGYCVTRCPIGPQAIAWDEAGLPRVRRSGCTGCGVCAYLCPGSSITIKRQRE